MWHLQHFFDWLNIAFLSCRVEISESLKMLTSLVISLVVFSQLSSFHHSLLDITRISVIKGMQRRPFGVGEWVIDVLKYLIMTSTMCLQLKRQRQNVIYSYCLKV